MAEIEEIDAELRAEGHEVLIGVDEVGRGCLAGPVMAAAVILPALLPEGIFLTDSKKLTATKREKIAQALKQTRGVSWAIGQADVAKIDEINILQATHLAMRRALEALPTKNALILIDGLPIKNFAYPHQAYVKGDSRSASIAAASIIAKVTRDQLMKTLAETYPGYDLEKHKGYGTAAHLRAIRNYGVTPIHRRSFAPVAEVLRNQL
jgi:ribonuclease HII